MARVTIAQLEEQIKLLSSEADALRQAVSNLTVENEKLKKDLSVQKDLNKRNAGRKRLVTDKDVEEMKKLYSEGKSYAEIGKLYLVSGTAVRNRLLASESSTNQSEFPDDGQLTDQMTLHDTTDID